LNNRPNELDKSKLSLRVAEQEAREYGGEGDIRVEGKKHLPRLWGRAGPWVPPVQRVSGGVSPPGPANHPNPILIIDSLLSTPGLGGGTGLRWGIGVGNPVASPRGRLSRPAPCPRWRPVEQVVPMRSVRTQKGSVGPRGLPPQAPLAGVGADFKTVSWGGSDDGRAGAVLARPEGPMGPRIAVSAALAVYADYAVSNATMLLSTTNANNAIFFTVLRGDKP
jgi:hypothetical protein